MFRNTFGAYLKNIVIIFTLFALLPIVLSTIGCNNTLSSYIFSVLTFFILTIISANLILHESKYVRFYAIAFIVEIILGLIHYLYFVDSNYFASTGDGSGTFWHEYLSVFNAINRLNESRDSYGIFYWMGRDEFQVTHHEIWHFISWPFYFLGNKWMNYSALNVFSSLLASMNILFIYNKFYSVEGKTEKQIRYWTSFFPIFLLSGTVWRDSFGIALISIGIVLVMLSKNVIERIVSLVIFGAFAFLQRTMYVFMAGISSIWEYISRLKNISGKIFFLAIGVVVLFFLYEKVGNINNEYYASSYVNSMSFWLLPIKIIFGMIGPFPWTLFPTLIEQNPAFAWQLQDYLMGTFQLGYLLCIVFNWKNISFKNLDVMTIMGFGIMLSGFLTRQLHIGYIAEGLLFTLPWFFSQVGKRYNRYFCYSFMILIGLNIFLLVIGNMGISSLWR